MQPFLVSVFVLGLLLGVAQRQVEEKMECSHGSIVSLERRQIVIKKDEPDTDKGSTITYVVGPKAEFKNVKSMKDVVIGDDVEIDYVTRRRKKIVKAITVRKGK